MRKTKSVVITAEGRDKGKRYWLTEMSALQADGWGTRALSALARSGANVPDDIAAAGLAGVATIAFQAIAGIPYVDASPLLAEMMSCVQIQPDPSHPEVRRPLVEDDIEEVSTLWTLRGEVFELHTGFSVAAYLSEAKSRLMTSLAATTTSPDSSNTETSPLESAA